MMTDDDRRMLDFAGRWWRTAGAAEDAIRAEFGISATRFWQKVNQLLEEPDAAAYAPTLVSRLRRIRDTRSRRRSIVD